MKNTVITNDYYHPHHHYNYQYQMKIFDHISDKLNINRFHSNNNNSHKDKDKIDLLIKIYADVIRIENKVIIINDKHNPFQLGIL
jgi:hypothetical protein